MTSNKQTASDSAERAGNWEETVTRFLVETPDYFARHPELLAALAIPHSEAGRAVSLVERQVKVLRDRNESMARELKELIQIARDNDQLGERLQRFAVAMIESGSLDEVLDTAQDMLRQEFSLEGVAVRLTGNPRPSYPRPEFIEGEDEVLDALLMRLAERNGQPLCGAALPDDALQPLFGAQAAGIRSTAVIGLGRRGLRGVLVLASHDPQRFRPDMGTVYLARVGDLLMSALARHLVVAPA
jgi:hypothetical protein